VAVNVVVDLIHMLGAAAWVGGLVFLLKAAYPASDTGQRERVSLLGPVVARFSDLAVLGVSAVVLSGTFAAYMQLRSWSALTGSAYGQVLLAKIAVFLPLVALGGFNKNVVKPRIDRAVASGDDAGGLATLRRIVSYEVTLAIVVVALTAWLVSLAPGREAAAASEGPYQTTVTLGEGRLDVLVVPNRVGENEVHLTAVDDAGGPQKLDEMSALFRMASEDIGPIVARGRKLAPGHYVIQGHQLSVPGDWTIEVVARTSRFEEERTTFPLTVRR
jgi:copper transport protein